MHIINFIWKSFRCCDERQPYKSLGGPRVFRAFIVVVECGWGGGWRLSLLKQAVSTDICNPQCPAIPKHLVFYLRTEGWETQNAVPWDTGPFWSSRTAGFGLALWLLQVLLLNELQTLTVWLQNRIPPFFPSQGTFCPGLALGKYLSAATQTCCAC